MNDGLIILIIILSHTSAISQINNYIDPTGTYDLQSKIKKSNGEIYGYTGQIQIKAISNNKIVMTFYVCKGAPSYNSGSFADTLNYINNQVVYHYADDPSCSITFNFSIKGITVKEKTNDYNSGCGFGHAVIADGYYRKTSSKSPILKDPMTDELIK